MNTTTLKEMIKLELPNIKFSLRHIKKGSMKGTFMMGIRKNKTTGQYESYTEFEQNRIIRAFNKMGFLYYNGDSFNSEPWRYFNGGMSIDFKACG